MVETCELPHITPNPVNKWEAHNLAPPRHSKLLTLQGSSRARNNGRPVWPTPIPLCVYAT